jgi:hypothetical protein
LSIPLTSATIVGGQVGVTTGRGAAEERAGLGEDHRPQQLARALAIGFRVRLQVDELMGDDGAQTLQESRQRAGAVGAGAPGK